MDSSGDRAGLRDKGEDVSDVNGESFALALGYGFTTERR